MNIKLVNRQDQAATLLISSKLAFFGYFNDFKSRILSYKQQ